MSKKQFSVTSVSPGGKIYIATDKMIREYYTDHVYSEIRVLSIGDKIAVATDFVTRIR